MKVFVTSGAIVPFKQLIESSLDSNILDQFVANGFDELEIQYGQGENIFNKALKQRNDIKITGIAFTNDINKHIESSDLIISHAGTGSILDAVRAYKPLIVMVNTTLMDNHQLDIATQFAQYGYLLVTEPTTSDLKSTIEKASAYPFRKIPPANSKQMAQIIDTEAGLL